MKKLLIVPILGAMLFTQACGTFDTIITDVDKGITDATPIVTLLGSVGALGPFGPTISTFLGILSSVLPTLTTGTTTQAQLLSATAAAQTALADLQAADKTHLTATQLAQVNAYITVLQLVIKDFGKVTPVAATPAGITVGLPVHVTHGPSASQKVRLLQESAKASSTKAVVDGIVAHSQHAELNSPMTNEEPAHSWTQYRDPPIPDPHSKKPQGE